MKNIKSALLIVIAFFFLIVNNPFKSIAQANIEIFDLVATRSWGDTICISEPVKISIYITNTGTTAVDSLNFKFEIPLYNVVLFTGINTDTIQPADTILFEFVTSHYVPIGYNDYTLLCTHAINTDTSRIDTTFYGVNCMPGFNEISKELKQITIYPNPAISQISIETGDFTAKEQCSLSIINSLGQEVAQFEIAKTAKTFSISIEDYPKGIYYIQLQANNGVIAAGKFIKE